MAMRTSKARHLDRRGARYAASKSLNLVPGAAPTFRILEIVSSDPYIKWELVEGSVLNRECSSFRLSLRLDSSLTRDIGSSLDGPH